MRRFCLIFAILSINIFFGQSFSFTIEGSSTYYNNQKIKFQPILINVKDSINTDIILFEKESLIKNNKFSAQGTINNYPSPLEVIYHDEINNRLFMSTIFIDNRKEDYSVNFSDLSKTKYLIIPQSKSQAEYITILEKMESEKIHRMPFDSVNFKKKYIFLQNYIKNNPKSFVALWMIISDYRYVGYKQEFWYCLKLFNDSVKVGNFYKF